MFKRRLHLLSRPPNAQVWLKAFVKVGLTQGRCPDTRGILKNASGPVGIPL